VIADVTEKVDTELRLRQLAHTDSLTGLANRFMLRDALSGALRSGRPGALLMVDLDHFKIVNDSLGHSAGDELLKCVAQRLRDSLRTGDTVARLGGDEFAVLAESLPDTRTGLRLAERVLNELGHPLQLFGTQVWPVASVGITFSDHGDRDVNEVLRDADLAMYEAKAGGRGRVVVFDNSIRERVADNLPRWREGVGRGPVLAEQFEHRPRGDRGQEFALRIGPGIGVTRLQEQRPRRDERNEQVRVDR